jgi:NAD(P)-dependent dehydrogenase (short-subunit alcohol dehydrogenase family)
LKQARERLGNLHGLVNAAGISTTLPLKLISPEKLDAFFKTNVIAAINLAKIFTKLDVVCREGGSIVFISSVMGVVGEAGKTMYSLSKGALIAGTRSLALELASKKIRVNAISPGVVETPMSQNAIYSQDEESKQRILSLHPLGLGTTTDIAHACIYLLSNASRWITGTNLIIDGGYTSR